MIIKILYIIGIKEFVDFKNFRFQSANVVDYLKLISESAQTLTLYPATGLQDTFTSIAMLANLEYNHNIFMDPK